MLEKIQTEGRVQIASVFKLTAVAVLVVLAGLIGFLTFERHYKLVGEAQELRQHETQIKNDPRSGAEVYEWKYHQHVTKPFRMVCGGWLFSVALFLAAVWIMFRKPALPRANV